MNMPITYQEICAAYERIKPYINHTPIMTSRTLNIRVNAEIYCKCENFQRIGAFKFRGAMNALTQLSQDQKKRGVITHSSGNHAQAIALAAQLLGVHAVIVMPKNSPQVKINATQGYGAEIVLCEPTIQARQSTTENLIQIHGYTLIHPYDNDQVICGQGTATLELLEEIPDLDIIVGPIGGGGLLSGTCIAAKGFNSRIIIYGAEPLLADDAFQSLQAGRIIPNPSTPKTIADGLLTNLCERTYNILHKNVSQIIRVTEDQILEAMQFLWERMKIIVEPSGAVSLAAMMSNSTLVSKKKVGVILSGGNVDLNTFFTQLRDIVKIREKK